MTNNDLLASRGRMVWYFLVVLEVVVIAICRSLAPAFEVFGIVMPFVLGIMYLIRRADKFEAPGYTFFAAFPIFLLPPKQHEASGYICGVVAIVLVYLLAKFFGQRHSMLDSVPGPNPEVERPQPRHLQRERQ